ncbi:MAG: hypothetical protein HOQ24_00290 [Mycobacteriaceae bacterium]|nr:hypothetical protein [Mycobacteriaceae bacterium]
MDIEVVEGAFVEAPTPEVTGMDRRAFGEFVGPNGELASYAFGWVTGTGPHEARMSIGIGAGNPGGATIHCAVVEHEDSYAFALVDEPFEDVPQGGPDLTAEQARAHEDLPFVWWVADHVLERDRRARWMRHWLMGTKCVLTAEVFELDEPVLLVAHEAGGVWQLIGASGGDVDTAHFQHLHHSVDEDPTLVDVLDLPPGHSATRPRAGSPWTRRADDPPLHPD